MWEGISRIGSEPSGVTPTPREGGPVTASEPEAGAVAEDGSVVFDLRALGFDVEDVALTPVIVSQPVHGVLTVNADGSYTYTPAPDYNGVDEIRFALRDSEGLERAGSYANLLRPEKVTRKARLRTTAGSSATSATCGPAAAGWRSSTRPSSPASRPQSYRCRVGFRRACTACGSTTRWCGRADQDHGAVPRPSSGYGELLKLPRRSAAGAVRSAKLPPVAQQASRTRNPAAVEGCRDHSAPPRLRRA